MWEVVARCSAKTSSWKFHKIYREIPVLESSFWRSSRPEVFCKKEVLENFGKFKGKHLCQSPACNFIKKETGTGVSCEFCEISQNTFSYRTPPVAAYASNTSRLQLYWRETPALVFQNQPFVYPLQNRCSWIIHKIHGKTSVLESLFK